MQGGDYLCYHTMGKAIDKSNIIWRKDQIG